MTHLFANKHICQLQSAPLCFVLCGFVLYLYITPSNMCHDSSLCGLTLCEQSEQSHLTSTRSPPCRISHFTYGFVLLCVVLFGDTLLPLWHDTLHNAYCNTLQITATHCNSLQLTATHCNSLQLTATHRNMCDMPHCTHRTTRCNASTQCTTLHHTPPHSTTLHHTAPHSLQHTATRGMHHTRLFVHRMGCGHGVT